MNNNFRLYKNVSNGMSRNNKAEPDRKMRGVLSSVNRSRDDDSELRQTRRNLKSPKLNGNSIIESTQKLAEMDIIKTSRIVSRHSSVQRENSKMSNLRDSAVTVAVTVTGDTLLNNQRQLIVNQSNNTK